LERSFQGGHFLIHDAKVERKSADSMEVARIDASRTHRSRSYWQAWNEFRSGDAEAIGA
jgi:hypothetical protein